MVPPGPNVQNNMYDIYTDDKFNRIKTHTGTGVNNVKAVVLIYNETLM